MATGPEDNEFFKNKKTGLIGLPGLLLDDFEACLGSTRSVGLY